MKDQLAPAGCRIDVFLQRLEAHAFLMKLSYGIDQVSKRAAKLIQSPDNEGIPYSKVV
jgi:hypothetical protein